MAGNFLENGYVRVPSRWQIACPAGPDRSLTNNWAAARPEIDGIVPVLNRTASEHRGTPNEAASADVTKPKRAPWRSSLWFRLTRALVLAVAVYYIAMITTYRFVNPPSSNWMLMDALNGKRITQSWVSIDQMSPHVVRAVVASEDARFCQHWGVDWGEIRAAIRRADHRGPRGASTITMQTTKNLFLWPGRSYLRKAIELPMTYLVELFWSKRRILEIYLNIAEWGPGIYGIEAAARHHFRTSAAALNRRQATLLAASLPNPARRRAGKPGRTTRKLAAGVRKRLRGAVARTRCIYE